MGGDAEHDCVNKLAEYIHQQYPYYKVGWYSGRTRLTSDVDKKEFDYIKVGPYISHLGGLKDRTTNQRLYKKTANGEFEDITARFWHRWYEIKRLGWYLINKKGN